MFTGLRSIIYPSSNLDADKEFWRKITGIAPYFEQQYYVGFNVGGCELGLDPNAAKEGLKYPITYWLVKDINGASEIVKTAGASENSAINDVGGGILMARFKDLSGNIFGLIENPHN